MTVSPELAAWTMRHWLRHSALANLQALTSDLWAQSCDCPQPGLIPLPRASAVSQEDTAGCWRPQADVHEG